MPLIILQSPFIRHDAGSVFDLEENPNFPEEYADEESVIASVFQIKEPIFCPMRVKELLLNCPFRTQFYVQLLFLGY